MNEDAPTRANEMYEVMVDGQEPRDFRGVHDAECYADFWDRQGVRVEIRINEELATLDDLARLCRVQSALEAKKGSP